MNKKNILVSGFSIMFLVGLIGFTTSLAAADPWPSVTQYPAGQPIILDAGGVGIEVGSLTYSNLTPVYLNPGESILANATVINTAPGGNSPVNLSISLDNITDPSLALAGMINIQVWVDISGTGTHTTIQPNDLYLDPSKNTFQAYSSGPVPEYAASLLPKAPLTIGGESANLTLPAAVNSTTTAFYNVHYALNLDGPINSAAEGESIGIGASLTGSQAS